MLALKDEVRADDEQILTYLQHERVNLTEVEVTLWALDIDHNLPLEIDINSLDPFDYAWSPDGRLVAVNVDYPGVHALISVFDMDGNELVHLYSDRGHFTEPNWLPDSEQLVFVFHYDMDAAIYSTHIDEPDDWQLLLELPNFLVSEVVVSPDGQWMLISGGIETNEEYLIEIGDETLIPLENIGYEVSWSPDGRQLAFTRSDENLHTSDIYLMNLTDGSEQRLTDDPNDEFQPAWSPNGTQIAFVSDRDGDDEIYIVNIDGTNVRQVTFNDVNERNPAWIP